VRPQVAGDLADPAVAVGILDHRAAVDLAQVHLPGAGADVGGAGQPVHGDVAGPGLDPAGAEAAHAVDRRRPRVALQPRAGRELDDHIDRPGLAEQAEATLLRPHDQQPAGRVLDPGLLGGPHVGLLMLIAGADVHDRVGAVAGRDADVADAEFNRDRNRLGGVEGGHGDSSGWGRLGRRRLVAPVGESGVGTHG
jgi:hypothetical protein